MEIKTYRAATMQQALELVRAELGPEAAVLHTREVRPARLLRWLSGARQIEVTASSGVNVPSRLPARQAPSQAVASSSAIAKLSTAATATVAGPPRTRAIAPAHLDLDYRAKFRADLKGQHNDLGSMVERLCQSGGDAGRPELPDALFRAFTDLIEADVSEEMARGMIEQLQRRVTPHELLDGACLPARLAELVEQEINVSGPIRTQPGRRRVVALVGPTGVGKTTTIAKLAAHFRLREKLRVGLVTVDTYRIAAVEQLRTYAEIIDLPMEIVATPRETREALSRLDNLDLVLMDTAGRSPRDEVRIQELKSMLGEARADEVHLVLSSVASASNLASTAERFAEVGATALIVTKLDEAMGLGHLLPLLRNSRLPVSYLTNGQNVPDDFAVADRRRLARAILRMDRGSMK